MMIAVFTFESSLVPLIEGLFTPDPCQFEFLVLDEIEPTA